MNTNKFYIFVADWCPYCRQAKSEIFKLMDGYYKNGNLILIEDSSDIYKELGPKLNATSFPAFIIADENDKEVKRYDGPRLFEHLLAFYSDNTDTPPNPGDNTIRM